MSDERCKACRGELIVDENYGYKYCKRCGLETDPVPEVDSE